MRRLRFLLFLMIAPVLLPGCSFGYYAHIARGQMDVSRRSEPISELLAEPSTPDDLRQRLTTVVEIRGYASQELALPDNDSYRSYADIERPYVVWNVFAAPEFSVEAKTWCFLIVGCVTYRGYFSEEKAEALAADLAEQGLDVYVGGVPAYSTLGRFDDPVLNTMLYWDETQVASIIFHELAHQVLYVKHDAAFSEAFATLVEEEGVRRWLEARGDSKALERYRMEHARQALFTGLVARTRERLRELYASGRPEEEMRARKQRIFEQMRAEYGMLSADWDEFIGYQAWFEEDLNNARLVSVVTYQRLVPAFRALLVQAGGDMEVFFERAAALAELPQEQRNERLRELLAVVSDE